MSEAVDEALLAKYRELVYSRYGIHYSMDKMEVLRLKLEKLAYTREYDLGEYFVRLNAGDPDATDEFLHAITVGHTFFFREGEHFQRLAADIRGRRVSRPVIWCAASSTGEEPYSIVITLLEQGVSDFLVLSSDVNPGALRFMNRGEYVDGRLQELSPAIRERYFLKLGADTFRVRAGLRSHLRIKRLNLQDHLDFQEKFDYVFCRNVMIYFDEAARRRAVNNVVRNLKKDGLLFVGHTEAILSLPPTMQRDGAACFRKLA